MIATCAFGLRCTFKLLTCAPSPVLRSPRRYANADRDFALRLAVGVGCGHFRAPRRAGWLAARQRSGGTVATLPVPKCTPSPQQPHPSGAAAAWEGFNVRGLPRLPRCVPGRRSAGRPRFTLIAPEPSSPSTWGAHGVSSSKRRRCHLRCQSTRSVEIIRHQGQPRRGPPARSTSFMADPPVLTAWWSWPVRPG